MNTIEAPIELDRLLDAGALGHPVPRPGRMETHISWILLTGPFAYKIKKPVDFGFLDYSTFEKRRLACLKEVAVNRRFSPWLYDQVVEIRGTSESPRIGGDGPILEHAIRMVEFPQETRMDRVLQDRRLEPHHMEALAREVARFHRTAASVRGHPVFGLPESSQGDALQNFEQVMPFLHTASERDLVAELQEWTRHEFERRKDSMARRWIRGAVRECHGDLHLQNLAWIGDAPVLFDAIEFNEAFRWIDTASEIAFLLMDLDARGEHGLGLRFLDVYLEETGDYEAVELLPYYRAYRAMVRAKVALFSLGGPEHPVDPGLRARAWSTFRRFTELALEYTVSGDPQLWITHGLSGSGKSTVARSLARSLDARVIRSDVLRKRSNGLDVRQGSGSPLHGGIYTPAATLETYRELEDAAAGILGVGEKVIVDATFLKRSQRDRFRDLCRRMGSTYGILDVRASPGELRRRLLAREAHGGEISEAGLDVLMAQQETAEPLDDEERRFALVVETEGEDWPARVQAAVLSGLPSRRPSSPRPAAWKPGAIPSSTQL